MTFGWVAAIVVGVTVAMAGALKLVNRRWRAEAIAVGTPRWVAPLVPPVELVLGVLLVVRVARPVVGLLAMLLLTAFTIFLLVKWEERRGEPCNCFGVLSKRPVSAWTIVRNLALIGLALVAAVVD